MYTYVNRKYVNTPVCTQQWLHHAASSLPLAVPKPFDILPLPKNVKLHKNYK